MKHQSKKNQLKSICQPFLVLLILFSSIGISCQSNLSLLDNHFLHAYRSQKTGASILVTENGKTSYEKQFGLANIKTNRKIDKNTKFQIGSITKQFTAAAILLLQERGKLKTSDYIGKYIKEFDKSKYPIKIEHLLTHTSGIASGIPPEYNSKEHSPKIPPSKFASFLSKSQLLFTPGEDYRYSNNGYIMLGLIIEATSEKSYEDFILKNIFKPLKMKNSRVVQWEEDIKNMALGYVKNDNNVLVKTNKYTSSFSAGAIVSTPRDLAKWVNGLFNDKIINKTSRLEMLQNYKLSNGIKTNMGYGWEINKIQGYQSFEHSGSEPGFKTNSIYIPQKNIYVIICQNTEEGSPTPQSINAASVLVGNPYPNIDDSIKLSEEKRNKLLGTYLLSNSEERYVGYNEDFGLYYKRPGGKKRKLYALNDNTLSFSRGYVLLKFYNINDFKGYEKFTYENRNFTSTATKKSSKFPKENKVVALESSVLKKYVGTYVSEQFAMLISYQDDKLYAQPGGSDRLELKPKGGNTFFIEEIGAEIEFISDKNADYINIVLEGNKMKGIKQ